MSIVTGEPPVGCELDRRLEVAPRGGDRGDDLDLREDQLDRVDVQVVARVADDDELAAAPERADSGRERLLGAHQLDIVIGACPPGQAAYLVGQAVVALAARARSCRRRRASAASAALSAESATAITRAPAAVTTWTAMRPTPPIPLTTTVCPSPIPARRDAWTTDIPLQASTAAVSNDTDSGSGIRFSRDADDVGKPAVQREAELADGIGAERLAPGPAGGQRPQPTKL